MSRSSAPTRNRILTACQNLLETKGTADVRMADIAKIAGISRQALYLHFSNRAELLVATTRSLDETYEIAKMVDKKIASQKGVARLTAFIDVWADYIPKIYGVGKALMAIKDTDAEARTAWDDRMKAVRNLCVMTVQSLDEENALAVDLTINQAVDMLWVLVSLRGWEQFCHECGWTQSQYQAYLHRAAQKLISQTAS